MRICESDAGLVAADTKVAVENGLSVGASAIYISKFRDQGKGCAIVENVWKVENCHKFLFI